MGGKRLAAVLFSDMHGYSRQMDADEAATLAKLERHNALFESRVAEHEGRTVKTIGDAFMVEFPSALAAARCGLALLADLESHNDGRSRAERIEVRIGIHAGDVTEREGDLFGDTVNIAARLEPIAPVGGLCVTASVFQQIRRKVKARVDWREHRELKNISTPQLLYGLLPGPDLLEDSGSGAPSRPGGRRWRLAAVAIILLILVLVVLVLARPWLPEEPRAIDPAAVEAISSAQQLLELNTVEAVDRAVGMLEQAVALEPEHAPGWLALCEAYLVYAGWGLAEAKTKVSLARRAAQRALALDPTLATAHVKLGDIASMYDWEWQAAEEHYRHALTLDPQSVEATVGLAFLLLQLGRTREAVALANEVIAGLGEDEIPSRPLASVLLFSPEDVDRGLAMLKRGLERDPKSIPHLDSIVVGNMTKPDGLDAALEHAERLDEAWRHGAYARAALAMVHAALGNREKALALLEQLKPAVKTGELSRVAPAQIRIELGEPAEALRLLEGAYSAREFHLVWLRVLPFTPRCLDDPEWKAFRQQDGYWRLMDRMGFPPLPPEHPGHAEEQAWRQRRVPGE